MAEFKLTISEPETGKTVQREVKEAEAGVFVNLKIGDTVNGDSFGLVGYEFIITGGSDSCGFPMRKGIQNPRKKVSANAGAGFRGKNRGSTESGIYLKKTVCGEVISDNISQVNLKITKKGSGPLFEEKKEEAKTEKPVPEEKTEEVKEEKPKPEQGAEKKEEPKPEEKKEEKKE